MDSSQAFLKDFLGLAGVSVGPYVVREIASLGGVALVYRGEHETLHNAVAVKVLTPEVATGEVRDTLEQLFLREAQILSQLRSEHILRAHHHGRVVCPVDNRERPYMVVDWLEGRTLSDEIDERRRQSRPYTLAEAVELLEPIALALDTAHASGIIHRDVNPRNIFLETVGTATPRAKLIDFGFAKDVAQTRNLQLQSVQGTLLARSPDFAAPEHYDREQYGELSENTDIYTFALTLVEMLTLHSPLRGATPEALAIATSDKSDRPTPNNRGAKVPHNVEQLFAEALAVDQFERPGSLLSWFRQLQQALRRPTTAPPQPASLPAPKRRRSLLLPIALLLLAAAGAGAAAIWWLTRPLDCPPGFADCNGQRGDGCEIELSQNTLHCGGCGNACATAHGAAACVSGACRIERCADESRRDCNGSTQDGCEVDVSVDAQNCGACGSRCSNEGATQVQCSAAKCALTCSKDRGDCDDRADNGCEAKLATDLDNCGQCGFSCRGTRCEAGFCVPKRLATIATPNVLAAHAGQAWVWSAGKLTKISATGEETTVADGVPALSALAVTADRVLWVAGEPPRVFSLTTGADKALPQPLSAPLSGPTPLALSSDGAFVSWANRSLRGAKTPAALAQRGVLTLALGSADAKPREAKCPDWPSRFTADESVTFCCDDKKPLAAISCPGGKCATPRRHPLPCPELMLLDAEHLYFFRGTRLYAMGKSGGQARQLAKRVRSAREIAQDATHVYWIEGDDDASVVRIRKPTGPEAAPDAPEVIAAKLAGASSLSLDEGAIYWTSTGTDKARAELHVLEKPRSTARAKPASPAPTGRRKPKR